jgi:hypothetical protein
MSPAAMKIATFNVNGIKSRQANLLGVARARAARRGVPAGTQGARRGISAPSRGGRRLRGPVEGPALVERRGDPGARHAVVEVRRGAARAARRTITAATWRRRSAAWSSPASTCPTATRSRAPSSTTSWPGSSG